MVDQGHQYETSIEWTEQRRGTLTVSGRPAIPAGAPPEYGGTDDVWSPEHLCVGAVNACLMTTFIAIAANSKVTFRHYAAAAVGTLEKVEGRGFVLTRISVKPRIVIGPDVDRGKIERLCKMTERNCFISNSLNTEVTFEPEIVVE